MRALSLVILAALLMTALAVAEEPLQKLKAGSYTVTDGKAVLHALTKEQVRPCVVFGVSPEGIRLDPRGAGAGQAPVCRRRVQGDGL